VGILLGVKASTLAVLLALAGAGLAQAGATQRPTLRLAASDPLVVRGLHFYPAERVRVTIRSGSIWTLRSGSIWTRRVRTTERGSFRVVFANATRDRCEFLVATANGVRGDHAFLRIAPAECAPP
jgi:hypothetical protein